jgi:hypothetical protein
MGQVGGGNQEIRERFKRKVILPKTISADEWTYFFFETLTVVYFPTSVQLLMLLVSLTRLTVCFEIRKFESSIYCVIALSQCSFSIHCAASLSKDRTEAATRYYKSISSAIFKIARITHTVILDFIFKSAVSFQC